MWPASQKELPTSGLVDSELDVWTKGCGLESRLTQVLDKNGVNKSCQDWLKHLILVRLRQLWNRAHQKKINPKNNPALPGNIWTENFKMIR